MWWGSGCGRHSDWLLLLLRYIKHMQDLFAVSLKILREMGGKKSSKGDNGWWWKLKMEDIVSRKHYSFGFLLLCLLQKTLVFKEILFKFLSPDIPTRFMLSGRSTSLCVMVKWQWYFSRLQRKWSFALRKAEYCRLIQKERGLINPSENWKHMKRIYDWFYETQVLRVAPQYARLAFK